MTIPDHTALKWYNRWQPMTMAKKVEILEWWMGNDYSTRDTCRKFGITAAQLYRIINAYFAKPAFSLTLESKV